MDELEKCVICNGEITTFNFKKYPQIIDFRCKKCGNSTMISFDWIKSKLIAENYNAIYNSIMGCTKEILNYKIARGDFN